MSLLGYGNDSELRFELTYSTLEFTLYLSILLDWTKRSMANGGDKEADAILSFLLTFNLSQPVAAISDLSDGTALFDILQIVYVLV